MSERDFIYLGMASSLVPFVMFRLTKGKPHPQVKPVEPFLVILALAVVYEGIFSFMLRVNPSIFFWIYTLAEFLAIWYFFVGIFGHRYRWVWKAFLWSFLSIFLVLSLGSIFFKSMPRDSNLVIFETLLTFVGAVLWFKEMFDELSFRSPWQSPAFYFISGFLLYFSGTLFFFMITDAMPDPNKVTGIVRHINLILSVFLNFTLAIGIWKGQHKSIQHSG